MGSESRNLTTILRDALATAGQGDPQGALKMLTAALCRRDISLEQSGMIAKHAGAISQGIGDLQGAIVFYNRAHAANPEDLYVRLALCQLHRELGQVEEACRALGMCLEASRRCSDQDLIDAVAKEKSELHCADGPDGAER